MLLKRKLDSSSDDETLTTSHPSLSSASTTALATFSTTSQSTTVPTVHPSSSTFSAQGTISTNLSSYSTAFVTDADHNPVTTDADGLINVSDRVSAGIIIGSIVGLFALTAVIFVCWKRRQTVAAVEPTKRFSLKAIRKLSSITAEEKPNRLLSLESGYQQPLHFRIIELPADEKTIAEMGGSAQYNYLYQPTDSLRGWDWHHHWYGSHNLRPSPYARHMQELWGGDGSCSVEMPALSLPTELSAVLYLPDHQHHYRGLAPRMPCSRPPPPALKTDRTAVMRREEHREGDDEDDGESASSLKVAVEKSPQSTTLGEVSPTGSSTMMVIEELVSPLSPGSQAAVVKWFSS